MLDLRWGCILHSPRARKTRVHSNLEQALMVAAMGDGKSSEGMKGWQREEALLGQQ